MLAIFILSVFLGAALLFSVQPMVGKLVLPLLGGSPTVWTTVMLFFQGMLLAGYGYAHLLSKARSFRTQVLSHAGVMAGALLLLPIGLPAGEGWLPDPEGFHAGRVLLLLLVAVGGPVFVLCSAAPLLQSWFARSGHRTAADPYFLYASSNAGSMASLLAYPVLIEPALTLTGQRAWWSVLYALFAAAAVLCGLAVMRRRGAEAPAAPAIRTDAAAPWPPAAGLTRERLFWLALSFVPAGLMMATTQHLTTDVAAVPFLWVLPLATYLLTFIIAFARGGVAAGRVCGWLLPIVVVAVGVFEIIGLRSPVLLVAGAHLLMLFLASCACHARLASMRPPVARLTEFYLLLSVGGVMAGIFCSITAPAVFNSIAEYPLLIVGACLLRAPFRSAARSAARAASRARRVASALLNGALLIPVLLMVPAYVVVMAWLIGPGAPPPALRQNLFQLCWIVPAGLCLALSFKRWHFALAVAMLFTIPVADFHLMRDQLVAVRTFFGVHRVIRLQMPGAEFHLLYHGRIEHGRQRRDPGHETEPLAYFTRAGPVGDVFALLDERAERAGPGARQRLAVIGLGAGVFAAYGRPERDITFYEIDPVVQQIATDPGFFSFIERSASPVRIVLGDARLTVARAPEASYDLIAMDAFSADAVPVHLISREAVALYTSRLRPGGLMLFNVSNIYIRLEPVLSRLAEDAGLVGLIRDDARVSREERAAGRLPSAFVVLARRPEDLAPLAADPRWRPLEPAPGLRIWTDDYSDLLSVVKWR